MARVLIIDDDEGFCYTLSAVVQNSGHEVSSVHTLKEGLERASTDSIDVIYLDVMMPDGSGLDLLPKIKETASRPEVIISTSRGDPEGAELAIKCGAWDYIQNRRRNGLRKRTAGSCHPQKQSTRAQKFRRGGLCCFA